MKTVLQKVHGSDDLTFSSNDPPILSSLVRGLRAPGLFGILFLLGGCSGAPVSERAYPESEVTVRALAAHIEPLFHVLDCGNEGYVEAVEVDEHFSQIYFPLDRDQSRSVSRGEFVAFADTDSPSSVEPMFNLADEDGNGEISPMEYRRFLMRAIQRVDQNHDGKVLPEEINP